MGGLLGSLPYLATAGHGLGSAAVSAAEIFASCLLFGVTFRYVLAADRGNVQLKSGAVAAFGMVHLYSSISLGHPHVHIRMLQGRVGGLPPPVHACYYVGKRKQ